MANLIEAVIFDLDGVITDTAEYHYRAWKRLADEEGIPFSRADNEKLRGISRRQSLELLLAGRKITEKQAEEWMARKNSYYVDMLEEITPGGLLPGVAELLAEIRNAGTKIAIASASRNAATVIERLGIRDAIDVLADGHSVKHHKPAPDLFLHAASLLDVPPAKCLVAEDAAAGIEAANAAGMITVGLGPPERVKGAALILPNLDGITLSELMHTATWRVTEPVFVPNQQHHMETVFAQGNGYLGTRGTLEEHYPGDCQGTLIHGMWDDIPIVFTELVNAPDWTAFRIKIDGEYFRLDQGAISDYSRYLDLRTGVLYRRVRWRSSKNGPAVDLIFERVPSLANPHLMLARVSVRSLDKAVTVEVHAEINGQVENPGGLREGIVHWNLIGQKVQDASVSLVLETRHTKKVLAVSAFVKADAPNVEISAQDCPNRPGITVQTQLDAGQILTINKYVTYFTSRDVEDPLAAAQELTQKAANMGDKALRKENDMAWTEYWRDSDVIIDGDDEAQVAVRHALFQLRIAAPTSDERVSIGAKSLSGFGYRGHAFWDTETFMLPFFTYTQPMLTRNMLMYRWHTLDGARQKARQNGFAGAQYAWESAETGEEVTPTWVPTPYTDTGLTRIWTGDIELHISSDIAYAIWQYWTTTGDDVFMMQHGVPIILETARFWEGRAEPEGGCYALRNVIGPDEYHDHVDNNVYTNRMVQWHLETALKLREWMHQTDPDGAQALDDRLNLTPERLANWRTIASNLIINQNPDTGLMEQFEGFFDLEEVDWLAYEDRSQSMQILLGLQEVNNYQVIKQPDVILLLCLLRDFYDEQTWQSNWDYYVPRTDHNYGSSLGPPIHAWAACEMDQPELAYEHFMRAARADLKDIRRNAADGFHAASAGGLWQAIVFGFAGLRASGETYTLRPRLPEHWKRLSFNVYLCGKRHTIDICAEELRR